MTGICDQCIRKLAISDPFDRLLASRYIHHDAHRCAYLSGAYGTHLTILQRDDFRVFGRTDHIIVVHDRSQAVAPKVGFAIGGRIGKVLPRLPRVSIIDRFLQSPQAGTGRVAHTDEQIRHMEFLWAEVTAIKVCSI